MKKLLSMIAVSTLVGTSASNLNPVFINSNVSHGFKSNQLNNNDISIQNENDTKPFIPLTIEKNIKSSTILSLPNNVVYIGTKNQGLWKSNDGINIKQVITGIPNDAYINDIAITQNSTIYVGTNGNGLWKSTDETNFEQVITGIDNDAFVTSIVGGKNDTIYVGSSNNSETIKGVFKSTDGVTFTPISGTNGTIESLLTTFDGTVYAGTTNASGDIGTIYKSNGIDEFTEVTNTNGAVQSLAVDSNNNIYAGTRIYKNNNGTVYKSSDGSTFTEMHGITGAVQSLAVDSNNNIYAGTITGLYKSNGVSLFREVNEVPTDNVVNSVSIAENGIIYVGTQNKGLYVTNPINLLLKIDKPDTFDKSWPLYNGIVYNSVQKIDIKENLVASAKLDNKDIVVPTTNLDLKAGDAPDGSYKNGEHTLILTLKDKLLANVFGGDPNTGQVTYKLWVKTAIDKKDIQYSTNSDNTDLTDLSLGFISNAGNTKNYPIIETKSKDGTGTHDASLIMNFDDVLIDYPNSYYVQGTVDETTNDFTETGSRIINLPKNLSIKTDGIYHLHLEDTAKNTYDSYFELGENNWKLKGTFNNDTLNKLKAKLNVNVNLTDPRQLAQATGWLTNYDKFVYHLFDKSLKINGKGFDEDIKKDLSSDFKWFLKPLTYEPNNEPNFDDGIDKTPLVKTITDKANEILNKGLISLPKNLNVNTSNVVNKSTLEHYTNWINNYQNFINQNKDKWINDIEIIVSRGFATTEQENQIKAQLSQFLNNDNIKNYLKKLYEKTINY